MDTLFKLAGLSPYMPFEIDGETDNLSHSANRGQFPDSSKSVSQKSKEIPIIMAALPGGKRMPLLKSVLTSMCENNCTYCGFRSGRDFPRENFKPEDLAKTCLTLYQSGVVKGFFISSGVAGGGVRTQDRLLATAEILRNKLGYIGYLHLKIMPGAEKDQVLRAMQLADRVSVNLEAPTSERLFNLCPEKDMHDQLVAPLRWVDEFRQNQFPNLGWKGRWPSSTTQFVVGGGSETDVELLRSSQYLFRKMRLTRVYYSGFKPIPGTPMENKVAVDPWRQNRLYQASFLLRDYDYNFDELTFDRDGNLQIDLDPKLAWAEAHLRHAPLEINRAEYSQLIRIPGIGPRGAKQILSVRIHNPLRSLDDLKRMGVWDQRAAPFILVGGRHIPVQLALF